MSPSSILVALGTDYHRFDRLVEWVVRLAAENEEVRWFVQHGDTDLPASLDGAPMLDMAQLGELFATARAVITHGGPGLILEARAMGHTPVVVPRQPELREHVDGHQLQFTGRLADMGLIRRALSFDSFRSAVRSALEEGPQQGATDSEPAVGVKNFEALLTEMLARRSAHRPRRTPRSIRRQEPGV